MSHFPHTHIEIDGLLHKIVAIDDAGGARHTHRVLLGCGLTVDTDLGGMRHAEVAAEYADAAIRLAAARDRAVAKHEQAKALAAALDLDASPAGRIAAGVRRAQAQEAHIEALAADAAIPELRAQEKGALQNGERHRADHEQSRRWRRHEHAAEDCPGCIGAAVLQAVL